MNKLKYILLSAILLLTAISSHSVQIILDKRTSDNNSSAQLNVGYIDIDKIFKEHPMTLRLKNECLQNAEEKKRKINEMQNTVKLMNEIVVTSTTIMNQIKSDLEPKPEQKTDISTQTPVNISPEPVLQTNVTTNTVINLPGMSSFKTTKSTENYITESTAAVKPSAISLNNTETANQSTSAVKISENEKKEKEAQIKEIEKWIEIAKKEIEKAEKDLITESGKDQDDLCKMEEENTNKVLEDIYKVLERVAEDENISLIVDKNQILYGQSAKDLTDKVLERLRGR